MYVIERMTFMLTAKNCADDGTPNGGVEYVSECDREVFVTSDEDVWKQCAKFSGKFYQYGTAEYRKVTAALCKMTKSSSKVDSSGVVKYATIAVSSIDAYKGHKFYYGSTVMDVRS